MGRKRQRQWDWLPKYVNPVGNWLIWRPYTPGEGLGRPVRVCLVSVALENRGEFYRLFGEVSTAVPVYNLRWLLTTYLASEKVQKKIAGTTRDDYEQFTAIMVARPVARRGGPDIEFGDVPVAKITRPLIRGYLDKYPSPIAGNRHIQMLSAAFHWAMQRYEWIEENPCTGVDLNPSVPRDRYIEDWEYAVAFLCAQAMRVPIMAPAMELSYLCRARRGEVFALTEQCQREAGLYLRRTKNSDSEITGWTPRLREAVESCRAIYPDARPAKPSPFLLHAKDGRAYTKNALDSAWDRVMAKAMTVGAVLPADLAQEARRMGATMDGEGRIRVVEKFNFHDIKAKGYTDHTEHYAGHKSEKMRAVYQRKPGLVQATR